MKRAEAKSEKLMADVARENKRLTQPLTKARRGEAGRGGAGRRRAGQAGPGVA